MEVICRLPELGATINRGPDSSAEMAVRTMSSMPSVWTPRIEDYDIGVLMTNRTADVAGP